MRRLIPLLLLLVLGRSYAQPALPTPHLLKSTVAIPTEPLGKPEEQYDWILRDRLRGGYTGFYDNDDAFLDNCQRSGLNTLLIHFFSDEIKGDNFEPAVRQWAAACRTRGLHFIPEIVFGSDEKYGNTQFGAFNTGTAARWTRTPCPLAAEYWERVVADRALIAAKIGTVAGVTGFCVDFEMYSSDETAYPGPCFCDQCFARFLREFVGGVEASQVPPEQRLAWAKTNGLAELYARWQEREVQGICESIERRVHALDPKLMLCTLFTAEVLNGTTRGFGTPTKPALVFEEKTYWGELSNVATVSDALQAAYPALYLPGLWLQPVGLRRLPELSRVAATRTYGYWYYTIYSLEADQSKLGEGYRLNPPDTPADGWRAIAEAGRLTDRALHAGFRHVRGHQPQHPRATLPLHGVAPKLDGEIGASEWRQALALGPFVRYHDGAVAAVPSRAWLQSDGQALYVAAEFMEPHMADLKATCTLRDDPQMWRDDCLELFVAPDAQALAYYQLIINPNGAVYDARCRLVGGNDSLWDGHAEAKVKRLGDRWTVEVRVPFGDFGPNPPRPGGVWRLNVCREQRTAPGEITCVWPTYGPFHQPARFAELVWQ